MVNSAGKNCIFKKLIFIFQVGFTKKRQKWGLDSYYTELKYEYVIKIVATEQN